MGLVDRLTGTRRPGDGAVPAPAGDVRGALLALNGPDVPYVVRDGAEEDADLVAEWRITEPAWRTFFASSQLTRHIRVRMRMVPKGHTVRALDEQWRISWVEGVPVTREYGRGPVRTTSRHWTLGRGSDGDLEMTETFRFDSAELKDPLRDTAVGMGWTWRGVVLGRL